MDLKISALDEIIKKETKEKMIKNKHSKD